MNASSEFLDTIDNIEGKLKSFEQWLPTQDRQNYKNLARNLKDALKEEAEKGRILRIGIIGSVKAGKSTFLNALLFDGEDILPKAATPMTASLTRLRFSEKPVIRFVFYTRADWEIIEEGYREIENQADVAFRKAQDLENDKARRDPYYIPRQIDRETILRNLEAPETLKACHQLVEQARDKNLQLYSLLGSEHRENVENLTEAAALMRDYIGSDGKYSPIVKYVELGLNDRNLQDLEIVDTPGLNDPVRSRSEETYRFICQCDAVFLLSRASQFLTNEDIELLRRTLADNGIKQITVIATQLDLGAQNEVRKTQSYREAIGRTLASIKRTAKNSEVPQAPVPVSSMFEIIARKKRKKIPLGPDERQIEINLSRFEHDAPATPDEFHYFSNMEEVEKELQKYRQEKDRIIEEHQTARAKESRRSFLDILDAMIKYADNQSRLLQDSDISSLKKLRTGLLEVMDNVNKPISKVFSSMESEAGQKFADLKQRIVANASAFAKTEVSKSTSQKTRNNTTGMWFWKKTHTIVYNVTTFTAQLADALGLLREFASTCEKDINATIKELFSKKEISDKLKEVVLPIYRKFEQENVALALNEDMIILPINALIERFIIPEWSFDNTPYNAALQKDFGGKIENDAISAFKTAYELQLQNFCADIRKKLDGKKMEICDVLLKASVNFTGDIRHGLEEQISQIMEQMKNREESLQKYNECKQVLEQCKKMIVN